MNTNSEKAANVQQIGLATDVTLEYDQFITAVTGYENKPTVSIEEAVKSLESTINEIKRQVITAKAMLKNRPKDLSEDQAAAIMLYTTSSTRHEKCVSSILNEALRSKNRQKLEPWFLYLKLFFVALDRLPTMTNRRLFRGIKTDVSDSYQVGQRVIWLGFSSCSTKKDVAESEKFFGKTGKRTMFIIDSKSGKNIDKYSYYINEGEVMLLPATQFQVVNCCKREGDLYEIHLKEMDDFYSLLSPLPHHVSPYSCSFSKCSCQAFFCLVVPFSTEGSINISLENLILSEIIQKIGTDRMSASIDRFCSSYSTAIQYTL